MTRSASQDMIKGDVFKNLIYDAEFYLPACQQKPDLAFHFLNFKPENPAIDNFLS